MPNDRQAEARSLLGRLNLVHHPIKSFCQPREMMRFHTATIIFHSKQDATLFRPAVIPFRGPSGEQRHSKRPPLFTAIAQGVFDQVQKHLNHLILIGPDRQVILNGKIQGTSRLIKTGRHFAKHNGHQIRDFDQITGTLMFVSLHARQVKQPINQAFQPSRLLGHNIEKLLPRPFIHAASTGAQGINEATQRGQRRAKLMTGMGYEIDPHPVQDLCFTPIRQHDKHACMPVMLGRNSSE